MAQLEVGGITTFTPAGRTRHVLMPDPYTTNIAFGGQDMQMAWITLSTTGRPARVRWSEPGLRLAFNA